MLVKNDRSSYYDSQIHKNIGASIFSTFTVNGFSLSALEPELLAGAMLYKNIRLEYVKSCFLYVIRLMLKVMSVDVTTSASFLVCCFKVFLHCVLIDLAEPWPQFFILVESSIRLLEEWTKLDVYRNIYFTIFVKKEVRWY